MFNPFSFEADNEIIFRQDVQTEKLESCFDCPNPDARKHPKIRRVARKMLGKMHLLSHFPKRPDGCDGPVASDFRRLHSSSKVHESFVAKCPVANPKLQDAHPEISEQMRQTGVHYQQRTTIEVAVSLPGLSDHQVNHGEITALFEATKDPSDPTPL